MINNRMNHIFLPPPPRPPSFQPCSTTIMKGHVHEITMKSRVHEVGIKYLECEPSTCSKRAWKALKLTVKILFAPITLLNYLIFLSFSQVASSSGLGTKAQIKPINEEKRAQLLALGGQEILFGFHKKSVLEGMFFQSNIPNPQAKTILLCTGSHLSYENYAVPMVKTLRSMGHHVMVFNYEGFGKSEGVSSEKSIYKSTEAAYQYLKQEKGCQDENIVGWGYSLGSGAVSDLASKHTIDVVIDRGFSSMSEVAYQAAPFGLKTIARIIFFVGERFNNLSKLKKTQGRIFIAQGMHDDTMKEEHHGKFLQRTTSHKQNVIYRKVDSKHHHSDHVWFQSGEDRTLVENFLNKK